MRYRLARSVVAATRIPEDVLRESLIGLPPTDDLPFQVADLWRKIKLLPDDPSNLTRQRLMADAFELGKLLERCLERDVFASTRPRGCWCLGIGGRDPRWIPFRDDEDEISYLRTFAEYCGCPDGEEAKAVAERIGGKA